MKIEIINKTVEQFCKEYTGKKFHALLCDPPYELGFMGKHWDRSGIVFKPETWAMLAQHLHPSAFGFSFASSRGWHRLACAIEDAGNVFHPSVFMAGWGFGSGFPKSTRIDAKIDKLNGNIQKIIGESKWAKVMGKRPKDETTKIYGRGQTDRRFDTEPIHPMAKTWSGHRYGLQALKPALEPILCWQKPYKGKAVDCITKTGAGALNVDGGRIGADLRFNGAATAKLGTFNCSPMSKIEYTGKEVIGRWPANLVLSHSPDCTPEKCVEGCAVEMLDRQSGDVSNGKFNFSGKRNVKVGSLRAMNKFDQSIKNAPDNYGDSGGASRFFFNADYSHEKIEFSEVVEQQIANADPIKYQAKTGRSEREAGCNNLPLVKFAQGNQAIAEIKRGKEEHRASIGLNTIKTVSNNHPTVKPISLTQYLATLLLPPVEYSPRRILIPFSGSGSEIIGAMLAGWDEIVAVEMEPEYVEIAQARVAWWQNIYEKLGAQGVKDILEKFAKEEPEEVREAKKKQMDLF